MVHSDNLRFTAGERLQDISKVFVRHVGIKCLERFQLVTQVILAKDDFGPRHKEFKSFTTHLFDENRNLHLATSAEGKYTGRLRLDELQRNIRAAFANQAFLDMPGSQQLAFASGQRRVVHEEVHLDRRGIDVDKFEGNPLFQIRQRFADRDLFKAGQTDNI